MSVTIYTDGSSKGNPGNGGYGIVLISGAHRKESLSSLGRYQAGAQDGVDEACQEAEE